MVQGLESEGWFWNNCVILGKLQKVKSHHVSISSSINRDDRIGKEIHEIVFINCTSFKNTRIILVFLGYYFWRMTKKVPVKSLKTKSQ